MSEFLARAPERAGELGELLSALLLVEDVKLHADATSAPERQVCRGGRPALERLGDFRILRELGRGGMGIVYEAEQESLNRHVAIKVLAPGTARSPQIIERFLREARAAAQLHHTNIVPVFSVGEREGLHYLRHAVHPRAQPRQGTQGGPTAEGPGRRQDPQHEEVEPPIPPGTWPGATWTRSETSMALRSASRGSGSRWPEALEYAHQQGTLHRDIKPSNILLDVHGVAWVTDFGLAKAVEDEDLTRTGDLVGTIRYMAPERFRGRCDGRSDEYSLGLTLYELLALRPAFDASDREGLLYQVNRVEPPRLRRLNPAIPVDLETIVHKAIEKEAAHRYAHAAELAEDLRCFLEDRPIAARRVSSTERLTRWARRNPGLATLGTALAGMLALVVVVIVLADLRLRRQHEATMTNLRAPSWRKATRSANFWTPTSPTLAPAAAADSPANDSRASGRSGQPRLWTSPGTAAWSCATRRSPASPCRTSAPSGAWEDGPHGGILGVDFDPTHGSHGLRHASRATCSSESAGPGGDRSCTATAMAPCRAWSDSAATAVTSP